MNNKSGSEMSNNGMNLNFEQAIYGEILNSISKCTAQIGISVDCIIDSFKEKYNAMEVRSAIEWLSDEGHVYSTVDDIHFKAVDDE